jgi:hypothetical protein
MVGELCNFSTNGLKQKNTTDFEKGDGQETAPFSALQR